MSNVPRHPGIQTLAAFVDGRLAADEIAYVADHLRGCGECRIVVSETARFTREEEQVAVPRSHRSSWLAAAAMIGVVGIGGLLLQFRQAGGDRLIADMIDAAPRHHRLVEPRLSGFPWARMQPPARGEARPADPADLQLNGVAGKVLEKTGDRPAADMQRARGVALVLIGRAEESIAALEQAARDSNDARAWNDLAAARYDVAVTTDRPQELPEALANVSRAIALDPRLPEARFNHALILERANLRDPARKAWEEYLRIDPRSEWSAEARAALKRLDAEPAAMDGALPPEELVRRFPQEAREHAEGLLFSQWAAAELAKDPGAPALLDRLRTFGDALQRTRGEGLLADAVAAIDRSDATTRATIALAFRTYGDGRMKLNRRYPTLGEPQLRRAAELFAHAGSPLSEVAAYYAAIAAFHANRTSASDAELEQLLARLDPLRHRALAGLIYGELAVHANAAGDWGSALRLSESGAAIFRALGETTNVAGLDGIGAVALEMIGDPAGAWSRRLQTFAAYANDPPRLGAFLHSASVTLAAIGREAAAAAILEVRIDIAPPGSVAELSIAHAGAARLAGQRGDAERAIARARISAAHVQDPALRKTVDAQIDLAGATSRGALDRSIDFFSSSGTRLYLPDAYSRRARMRRDAGEDSAAEADYVAALQEIESQRTTVRDGIARLQFLDTARRLIEDLIEFRLGRGDTAGAFDAADRARSLQDQAAPPQRRDLHLPPDVVVIEYAVLPREVVAFVITSGGLSAERIAIDRAELESRVDVFVESLRRRDPLARIDAGAESLHQLLLARLHHRLAGATELVIVPDRKLHALPFAVLRNAKTKKYLVEELTVRIAPSASSRGESNGPLAPALVVADPPTPKWPELPASREEAGNIAALHRATLLDGSAATRAAFVEGARHSALIHFSGHANSDAGTSYGALLLAPSGRDSGILGSGDIAALQLDAHPLVVLAACGTFRGDARHVAGMSSISRAFLTAGARGVMGTLWEIDDDVSATLFLRLHTHLRAGVAPALALRHAQRDLLSSGDAHLAHPATWAPVELLAHL